MKRTSKILLAVAIFYFVVSLGALIILRDTGTIFDRTRKSFGAQKAALSDNIVGEIPETEHALPSPVEYPEEENRETVEAVPDTEEPVQEPEPTEEPVFEGYPIRYLSFVTNTVDTNLNMRNEPSMSAKVTNRLAMKTTGYVIKPGNTWCYVVTSRGNYGYCSTEFLLFTEYTKDTFPAQYADEVEAPEEELNYQFENLPVAGEETAEETTENPETVPEAPAADLPAPDALPAADPAAVTP